MQIHSQLNSKVHTRLLQCLEHQFDKNRRKDPSHGLTGLRVNLLSGQLSDKGFRVRSIWKNQRKIGRPQLCKELHLQLQDTRHSRPLQKAKQDRSLRLERRLDQQTLTTVATVGAGDELLWPLVTVLLLGPEAETADGDGLCHRLERKRGTEEVH